MPNKAYLKGINFEYRVKRLLESRGFYVVRSAGSRGEADLIAIRKDMVLAIQCKLNSVPSAAKFSKLLELENYGAIPVLATTTPKGELIMVRLTDREVIYCTRKIDLLKKKG